jgi:hypothetical protein
MTPANPPIRSDRIMAFLAIIPLIGFFGPFLAAISPHLLPSLTNITTSFFTFISPNPTAYFLFAHLLLLTLSAFAVEPNHVGRLLYPERYYNGRGRRYRLFYVLAASLGCATFSVADAWKNWDSRKKDFWVEVVKHVLSVKGDNEVCGW